MKITTQQASLDRMRDLQAYGDQHGGIKAVDIHLPEDVSPQHWRTVTVHYMDSNRARRTLLLPHVDQLITEAEVVERGATQRPEPWHSTNNLPLQVLPSVRRVRQVPLIDEIFRGKATLP